MDKILIAGAAGSGLLLGLLIAWPLGVSVGQTRGRATLIQEQALVAASTEQARAKDDAQLRDLSNVDLCERSLRARGLPVDTCSGLRRLP